MELVSDSTDFEKLEQELAYENQKFEEFLAAFENKINLTSVIINHWKAGNISKLDQDKILFLRDIENLLFSLRTILALNDLESSIVNNVLYDLKEHQHVQNTAELKEIAHVRIELDTIKKTLFELENELKFQMFYLKKKEFYDGLLAKDLVGHKEIYTSLEKEKVLDNKFKDALMNLIKEIKSYVEKLDKDKPFISVIIPVTSNTEVFAEKLIDSIKMQTYPNKEIIVISQRSKDDISKQLEPYATYLPEGDEKWVAKAKNQGTKLAHGKILVFADPDLILSNDVLTKIFEAYQSGACGGYIKKDMSIADKAKSNWYHKIIPQTTMGIMFCSKECFFHIGGFDPRRSIDEKEIFVKLLGDEAKRRSLKVMSLPRSLARTMV